MGLRTLMAVATMAAGVVLVGWGAVGIAALTSPTEQSGEPSRHEAPEAAIGPVPSQAVATPVMTPSAATTAEPRAEAPRGAGGERKAKRRPDNFDGRLTVAQIAQIKRRLKLSPEQERNW